MGAYGSPELNPNGNGNGPKAHKCRKCGWEFYTPCCPNCGKPFKPKRKVLKVLLWIFIPIAIIFLIPFSIKLFYSLGALSVNASLTSSAPPIALVSSADIVSSAPHEEPPTDKFIRSWTQSTISKQLFLLQDSAQFSDFETDWKYSTSTTYIQIDSWVEYIRSDNFKTVRSTFSIRFAFGGSKGHAIYLKIDDTVMFDEDAED